MKTIKIKGKEIKKNPQETDFQNLGYGFEVDHITEVTAIRGDYEEIEINGEEDDAVDILLGDGGEWIGPLSDVQEIFGDQYDKRGSTNMDKGDFLPSSLISSENRGVKEWALKKIALYKHQKNGKEIVANHLGKWVDQKIMPNPGLFQIDQHFTLQSKSPKRSENPLLIFIHGTISSTLGSFAAIKKEDKCGLWDEIVSRYGGNIFGLEHNTISVSPFQNALDLLKNLPKGSTIDIISHSRGGIVADILARCDKDNSLVFTKYEIALIEKEVEKLKKNKKYVSGDEVYLMKCLNEEASKRDIKVRKIIRVACPAAGTIILSKRLDHFLNGLLNGLRFFSKDEKKKEYDIIKNFCVGVIKARLTPEVLPGLLAMVPGSTFQKVLNNPFRNTHDQLYVVQGDSDLSWNLRHSFFVILSNLFYREANDFVVHTASMAKGSLRSGGVYVYKSKGSDTSHFNYFKNEKSQKAIKAAVLDDASFYNFYQDQDQARGILIDLFAQLGEAKEPYHTQQRPPLILLPGIMGTNLYVKEEKIWLDFNSIFKGKIKKKLDINQNQPKVLAKNIIKKYYQEFINLLSQHYDVHLFPYDWRKPVDDAAELLEKDIQEIQEKNSRPLKIVAHSMGGLVVRSLMIKSPTFWDKLSNEKEFRFLMLGTPWYGSHLVMEVLTGHSKRVKQLAALDFHHSKDELMDVFRRYPGIYNLLPIKGEPQIDNISFWKKINDKINRGNFDPPNDILLRNFKQYKNKIIQKQFDFNNIFYLAGKAKGTTYDYTINNSIFFDKLEYIKTPDGDGSVTWELGIPNELPDKNLYFCRTEHGQLANDDSLFSGIIDILNHGATDKFDKKPSRSRGEADFIDDSNDNISSDPEEALANIFGITPDTKQEKEIDVITISVTHGDLKFSKYPVMVGHFEYDGIVSGEGALNRYLDYKLSNRHSLGQYPGKIGENLILFDKGNKPQGGLVIGLGDAFELNSYRLRKTVELSIIDYVMSQRDNAYGLQNGNPFTGISTLLIGSGYAQIPEETSIRAILEGVTNANEKLKSISEDIAIIDHIEFVDYYEDKAEHIYWIIKNLQIDQKNNFKIRVDGQLREASGGIKRFSFKTEGHWWINMRTTLKTNNATSHLVFNLSRGIARVEADKTFTSRNTIDVLLQKLSVSTTWNKKVSKTLFELLVPNNFKEVIRSQNNIQWKMDLASAAFPWEMFHDPDYGEEPTFVKAGLVRQLITEVYRKNPSVVKNKKALIIGDPIYNIKGLGQLPGARKEAQIVHDLLDKSIFSPISQISKTGVDNLIALTNNKYKILHISGHGVYEKDIDNTDQKKKERRIGIAIGDDIIFSAKELGNLAVVPEFVFINCCYSGMMHPDLEEYYQERYRFAANIGTQLIQAGASAVIITGWAVADSAALTFATEFYKYMLSGYGFGEATKMARNTCYLEHPASNTWGAYQCYGDPHYTLTKHNKIDTDGSTYILKKEVVVDLENLLTKARNYKDYDKDWIITSLQKIMTKSENSGYFNAKILELQARIYRELNHYDQAIELYDRLMKMEDSHFRVRSIEHYCNLISKKLIGHLEDGGNTTTPHRVAQVKKALEGLALIGQTAQRLNIIGAGYKRIAQLSPLKDNVKRMTEAYWLSYTKTRTNIQKSIYPLTNALCGVAIYKIKKWKGMEDKVAMAIPLLNEKLSDLQKVEGYKKGFWDYVRLINIQLALILFTDNKKQITKLLDAIKKEYDKAFEDTGSLRKLATEIEHVDFLIEWKWNQAQKFALYAIKQSLEARKM